MFQFARTSAKAVLVAAGTAGFVALGAGAASADALGAAHFVHPPSPAPTIAGLTDKVDQVQPDAEVPHVAHTLPAPGGATHLTSEAEHTLYTVQRTAGLDDKVQQTAAPKVHGLAHKTVNSVPNQVLPQGTNGTVHKTLNGVLNGSVTGVAVTLIPQTGEKAEELGNEVPEADAGAVKGKAGEVADEAPVEVPEADAGAVKDKAGEVADEAPEVDAPSVPVL